MKPIFFIAFFIFAMVPSFAQFTDAKWITVSENQSVGSHWQIRILEIF